LKTFPKNSANYPNGFAGELFSATASQPKCPFNRAARRPAAPIRKLGAHSNGCVLKGPESVSFSQSKLDSRVLIWTNAGIQKPEKPSLGLGDH
jgi:hypothetical protein